MVKFDWRQIDFERIFTDTCEILWLGFVALLVLAIVVLLGFLFYCIPFHIKIIIFTVTTVIVIFGSILRFGFGVRDN